jgi:sugar diacid utilization regulator
LSFTAPPQGVLAALGGTPGGVCAVGWERSVLIAVVGTPAAPVGTCVRAIRKLAEKAADACAATYDRAFVAGLAMSETAATAGGAVREAVEVSAVLARSGLHWGAAFSEEVALDILIGTHDRLRRRIAERIADVASRPDLWETLDALYRADLDRGRTARQLGIHRSTLDYRLNRVEQLAGISPTSVQGIQLFAAARAAISSGASFSEPHDQSDHYGQEHSEERR